MRFDNFILPCITILLILLNSNDGHGQQLICENRNPEGHTGIKRNGDGGYKIVIQGPHSLQGQYVPNEVYTISIKGLSTRYTTQKFTEFLLVVESEKQVMMGQSGLITTGIFHIRDDTQTRFSDFCTDGVTSTNLQPKSEISVLWTAPSILVASCVTFKATVVERPHKWFMDDDELSKTLCPYSTPATTQPPIITNNTSTNTQLFITTARSTTAIKSDDDNTASCCPCDDAKYDITFEGIWSRETHPKDFPENEWLLHFSDIIGASHSKDFYFWEVGKVASEGIRHVAEWGSNGQLQKELKAKGKYINTIIKAKGLWHPNENGKTSAAFRVDRKRHLMSLVTMIGPSPDWFVGLSGIDLCTTNCTWAEEAYYDLFPYDAGTDSGITYMSPNTPTDPRGRIQALNESYPKDPLSPFYDTSGNKMKPLAKLQIRRQRIYPKNCNDVSLDSETNHEIIVSENSEDANRPECAVSEWTSWSDCSVTCGKGLRMRKRTYNIPMKADMMNCDRQLVEKEMCLANIHTCDGDFESSFEVTEEDDQVSICAVTKWSEWTPCSVTCGKGVQTRSRRYKNHMGRKKCNLETSQTEMCIGMKEECDPAEIATTNDTNDVDCRYTPWSEWTPCNVSCGEGYRTRARFHILINEDDIIPPNCYRNEMTQVTQCKGEYGECGLSMEQAKEICMMPSDRGPCRASKQLFFFNIENGMCIPFIYGGCKGNRNRFETISECHSTCGFLGQPGTATSTATTTTTSTTTTTTTPASSIPDERIEEQDEDEQPDILELSKPKIIMQKKVADLILSKTVSEKMKEPETIDYTNITPLDIDCVVSEWSSWTACSVSCGLGHQIRIRTILVEPQNEGKRCPRRLRKRRMCRMLPCNLGK